MTYTQFRLEKDADGIVLATWDAPGRSMNLIDDPFMRELEAIVDETTADATVKGVVVASGKDSFSGGADLTMLEASGRILKEVSAREGVDKAMPAPTQSVTSAVCLPVRSSSSSTVPRIMAPVAPSGWPMAMAPPFGLTFSGSMSKAWM